eukprot:CAMPEP_0185205808 /NCGR_PEP_ID=MMETSP1140-20130426/57252_1 /TAXON_ID=298111 /ORGANISM="Pavlova sp., Strain CCMP459" /LENGTH=320 /DNA_ID=CAMNT_0027773419 /DNA_START=203 /DNA_END=1169 /DNA_ORIENTATION=+
MRISLGLADYTRAFQQDASPLGLLTGPSAQSAHQLVRCTWSRGVVPAAAAKRALYREAYPDVPLMILPRKGADRASTSEPSLPSAANSDLEELTTEDAGSGEALRDCRKCLSNVDPCMRSSPEQCWLSSSFASLLVKARWRCEPSACTLSSRQSTTWQLATPAVSYFTSAHRIAPMVAPTTCPARTVIRLAAAPRRQRLAHSSRSCMTPGAVSELNGAVAAARDGYLHSLSQAHMHVEGAVCLLRRRASILGACAAWKISETPRYLRMQEGGHGGGGLPVCLECQVKSADNMGPNGHLNSDTHQLAQAWPWGTSEEQEGN